MRWMRKNGAMLALAGAVLLYLFLACYRLSRQDALPDEVYTLATAQKPAVDVVFERLAAGHVPLYFLLMHALVAVGLPQTLPMLEVPSILLGLIGLLLFYALAGRLHLGKWQVLAPYLWAVHPIILYHDRLARPNAGAFALECLVLLLVTRFHKQRASRTTIGILAITGIVSALWLHILIATWLIVLLVALLSKSRPEFDRRLVPICVFSILLHGLTLYLCNRFAPLAISWVAKPTAEGVISVLTQTLGGERFYWGQLDLQWALGLALAVTWIAATGTLLFGARHDRIWLLVYASAVLPVLVMIAISLFRPILHERYLSQFIPPLLLCFVHWLSRAQWQRTAAVVSAILVIGTARADRYQYRTHETGIRGGIEKMEEVTTGRNDLGVCYVPTFEQMLTLFARRAHKIFVLDGWQPNNVVECYIEEHLRHGGVLWELAPGYWSSKLWDEMADTVGQSYYTKDYPLFTLRVYSKNDRTIATRRLPEL